MTKEFSANGNGLALVASVLDCGGPPPLLPLPAPRPKAPEGWRSPKPGGMSDSYREGGHSVARTHPKVKPGRRAMREAARIYRLA